MSTTIAATYIPPADADKDENFVLNSDTCAGVEVAGWTICAEKTHISGFERVEEIEKTTKVKTIPEMTFGENYLAIKHHASGFAMNINVCDALVYCLKEHCADTPVVEVAVAEYWKDRRSSHDEQVDTVDFGFDWTYTTKYNGTPITETKNEQNEQTDTTTESTNMSFVEDPTALIDVSLLMRRDPILFYRDIPLFDCELDDNGVSTLSAKIRVMPTCLYILMRFFLRVDRVLIRLYDTRIFHKFGSDEVIREQTFRECPISDPHHRYRTAVADDFRSPHEINNLPLQQRIVEKVKLAPVQNK